MDNTILANVAPKWRANFDHDTAFDTFHKKLTQAESLAHAINSDEFCTFNAVIQRNVFWLLGDLLTEARLAFDESEKEKQP